MGNIIGEEIRDYVAQQIRARQILHGSGVNTPRTTAQLNYLNSNTSWIKLASGVSISPKKLTSLGISTSYANMELAKANILYAGISDLKGRRLFQKEGFLPQDPKSSYTYGEFGYSPMPGVISADIKALNRGSLKKATVKLKVHNVEQFEIIDVLYLRLGYTVLLEWGNSLFTPNGIEKDIVRNTLVEDLFFDIGGSASYLSILDEIDARRAKYCAGYDALLGKISNFEWSFQEDGSYDITLTIISIGDVIESLKTNISIDKNSSQFLQNTEDIVEAPPIGEGSKAGEETPDPIEENKDANLLTFMLWVWKYTNRNNLDINSGRTLTMNSSELGSFPVGKFLNPSETVTSRSKTYDFYITKKYEIEEPNDEYQPVGLDGKF
jgi:hypothetical protein